MSTPLTVTTILTVLNQRTTELVIKEKDFYNGLFSAGFFISNFRVMLDIFKVKSFCAWGNGRFIFVSVSPLLPGISDRRT